MFKADYTAWKRKFLLSHSFDLNENQMIPMKMLNALMHSEMYNSWIFTKKL